MKTALNPLWRNENKIQMQKNDIHFRIYLYTRETSIIKYAMGLMTQESGFDSAAGLSYLHSHKPSPVIYRRNTYGEAKFGNLLILRCAQLTPLGNTTKKLIRLRCRPPPSSLSALPVWQKLKSHHDKLFPSSR